MIDGIQPTGVNLFQWMIFCQFPLLPAYGHRTEIQNSTPVWLADKPEWKHCGLTYARLRFTTEAPAECADIFRAYQTGAPASGPFTRGLYYRGVD